MIGGFRQRSASKFGNEPRTVNVPGRGRMSFHSGKEATRAVELGALEKCGEIQDLEFQPQFNLDVTPSEHHPGGRVCKYIADFSYTRGGERIVEDAKGYRTEVYLIKRRLMKVLLGIEVLET